MIRSDSKYRLKGPIHLLNITQSNDQATINKNAIFRLVKYLLLLSAGILLILFLFLHKTKYSWYDIKTTDKNALKDEIIRLSSANDYLINHLPSPSPFLRAYSGNSNNNNNLCIFIISGSERPQEYLTQTTAFLLSRIGTKEEVKVVIVNTNNPSYEHKEAIKLSQYVQVIVPSRRNNTLLSWLNDEVWSNNVSWWSKGVLDFAAVFDLAYDWKCPINVILEDDAIVSPHFTDTLLERMKDLLFSDKNQCSWVYVKLFWTHFWDGWEAKKFDFVILSSISLTISMIFTLLLFYKVQSMVIILPSAAPRSPIKSSNVMPSIINVRLMIMIIIFLFSYIMTLVIMISIGKQNWKRWIHPSSIQNGLILTDASAAAVGQVYSKCHLKSMADFLYQHATDNQPVDLLFNDYVAEKQGRIYELVPNLVQHIGLHSSSAQKNKGTAKFMKISSTFQGDSVHIS